VLFLNGRLEIRGGACLERQEYPKPTEKEEQLLKLIREIGFGELHIHVANGQPVRAEEIKKSIKF
jgi:hypothetical protein